MQKNTVLDDELIFFDAEILDDDDDAPVGTLFTRPEPTVTAPAPATETPVPVVNDPVPTAPSLEETPVEIPSPKKAPAVKRAPIVEEVKTPTTGHISLSDSFDKKSMDMSFDYAIELAPLPKSEPKKAKAPAKPKTTPVKKEFTEADIWGTATIGSKKKAEPVKEEPKADQVKPVAKQKAPQKPKTEQKMAEEDAKKVADEPKKEEVPVKTTKARKTAPKAVVATEVEPEPVETTPAPAKKAIKKAVTKPDANNVEINKTNEEENKVAKEAKEIKEQILVEGEGAYHGKFVIKKTDKGHFVYKLFAYGNKCVAIGAQAYEGLSGCKGGIASVQRIAATAPVENQTLKSYETLKFPKWEIYADKKGEFRLRLYASNGNLVATTNDGYLSVSAAKKGIESVGRAAAGASIVRCDDLW